MNKKKAGGFYLTIAAAVLAIVGAVLYGSVMYKMNEVYILLAAAIVLGVLAFVLAGKTALVNLVPVVNAALMASAAVWSANLMVNQIGYVIAGLDGMDTIQGFIVFCVIAVVAMLLNIIASFMPMAKEA
ncbi:hypothetical protein [Ruminococcus sp. 5_1_39BFAA]|uniref:hypothetical protein n=1 Tax=Ruminococcus sp. 5_1_39BFAA TaxID=457412 RepID=UPI0035684632